MKERRTNTPDDYAAALRATGGLIAPAARRLGVTRSAVYATVQRYPEVREALEDARAELLDLAESRLHKAVQGGHLGASMFILDRLGQSRGYGRRAVEVAGLSAGELSKLSDEELAVLARELN